MRKLNMTIVAGLLVALLGFVLVFAYGSRVDSRVAEGKETVSVLVAASAATAGMTPAELGAVLETREVPRLYVAEGALSSLEEVADQVLLGPLAKGAQVTAAQFGAPGVAGMVRPTPGRLALAVGVSLTPGVARYITPGSRVDVFVTYESAAATGDGVNPTAQRTKLFATGVKVMSVSVAQREEAAEGEGAPQEAGQVVAVLDLSPADAEKVVNAATLGSLYLALASDEGEPEKHTTTGVTPEDVVGSNR